MPCRLLVVFWFPGARWWHFRSAWSLGLRDWIAEKRRCKKSDEVMYGNILINADSWKCRGHLLLCKFHRLEALDSIIMIGYRCTFLAPTSFYFQFAPPVCFPIEQHVTKLIRLAVAYSPRGLPDQTTRADPIRAQRIRFGGGGTGQTLDQTVKP